MNTIRLSDDEITVLFRVEEDTVHDDDTLTLFRLNQRGLIAHRDDHYVLTPFGEEVYEAVVSPLLGDTRERHHVW